MSQEAIRKFYLYKLERDWPALQLGLHNGRKLNRLSTKQLEAKLGRLQRSLTKKRNDIATKQLSGFYDTQIRPEMSKLERLLQTQTYIAGGIR